MGNRVVLKLSGESFADPELNYGIDPATVARVAGEIVEVHSEGHQVVVVVGGLGSLSGALLVSLILGELNAFGIQFLPRLAPVIVFLKSPLSSLP